MRDLRVLVRVGTRRQEAPSTAVVGVGGGPHRDAVVRAVLRSRPDHGAVLRWQGQADPADHDDPVVRRLERVRTARVIDLDARQRVGLAGCAGQLQFSGMAPARTPGKR